MTAENAWHPRRWAALMALLLAVFMDMVDNQIVAVALPSIQRGFGAGGAALEWIAAGYTLAFAVTLITGGRLGDRYGRKPVFVLGTAGFTVTSLLAGLSAGAAGLIAARVGQGVCAGLMIPQVMSFVQAEFPPEERGKAFGVYGSAFPIGGLAGPLLGGILTQADLFGLGWRAIFLVNLPIGVLAVTCAALLMPARSRAGGRVRLDTVGVALFAVALLAVLFPLVQGWGAGWPDWMVVTMLAAVPMLAIFLLQQRFRATRGREPLIHVDLLRRPGFTASLLVALLFLAGMGVFFVLTLRLQTGLGYSPITTALTFLPATIGIVAGNGLARSLTRLGRGLVPVGILFAAAGSAALLLAMNLAGQTLTPWQLIPGTALFGLGLGVVTGTLIGAALAAVPADEAGSASGVLNTTLQLGTAAGTALLGTVFLSGLAAGHTSLAAASAAMLVAGGLLVLALGASSLLPRITAADT